MNEGLLYVLVGGLIGYGSSVLQYVFALKRQKKEEIWKEKIRIYSKVLEELGKSFVDLDNFPNNLFDPVGKTMFNLRLGSILAPARLVASDELETELRNLYDEEVAWFENLNNKSVSENDKKFIADKSIEIRYKVEQLMRKELKNIKL